MEKFYERLDVVLARKKISGYKATRRLLRKHFVTLNGRQVFFSGEKISLFTDELFIDGKKIELVNDLYIMMNKASGEICSTVPSKNHLKTVYDNFSDEILFPQNLNPLHSVGRLDFDTEGLLIFTTNGDLSHKLCSPEFHIKKTYFAELENPVSAAEQIFMVEKFAEGFEIERYGNEKSFFALPSDLKWIGENRCVLTICEGKFHQVKRMFLTFGNKVKYLKRIKMGGLELDENLGCGEWRFLKEEEVGAVGG